MKVPGFTAEVSLGRGRISYYMEEAKAIPTTQIFPAHDFEEMWQELECQWCKDRYGENNIACKVRCGELPELIPRFGY